MMNSRSFCKTSACNPACSLNWHLNGNKLNSGAIKRFKIQNEQSVSTNGGIITISRLNINSVQIKDHGHRIECLQSNALFNQTIKRNYNLHVLRMYDFLNSKKSLKFIDSILKSLKIV